ncbi:hypothetical protein ACLK19_24715 [Escherichia coli]
MRLTLTNLSGKTKKFSRFCLDALCRPDLLLIFTMHASRRYSFGVTHAGFLNRIRKPTLDLRLEVRREMWFKPFMQSYLVVFMAT